MSAMIGGSRTARMPGHSTIAPTVSRGADGRCDQLVDVGDEEPLELRQVQGPLIFLGLDTAVERGAHAPLVLLRRGGPITGIQPAAECFPMISEAELQELAVDTAANGLREPITLDPPGAVLDERNRLKACDIAGIAPQLQIWDGENAAAVAYVVSLNLHRRHPRASALWLQRVSPIWATVRLRQRTNMLSRFSVRSR